jgi:hypothetical protein
VSAVQSRTILERVVALVVTGGVVFASSVGGIHDPRCPHHAGNAGAEAEHAPAHAGHHGATSSHDGSRGPAPQSGGEGCTCDGGLCVTSLIADPRPQPSPVVSVDATREERSTFPVPDVRLARPERGALPLWTGPPAV